MLEYVSKQCAALLALVSRTEHRQCGLQVVIRLLVLVLVWQSHCLILQDESSNKVAFVPVMNLSLCVTDLSVCPDRRQMVLRSGRSYICLSQQDFKV